MQTSIKGKIDIIFSGAGLPLDLSGYKTKESETKLVPIVSSGRAANIIAKKWLQHYNYLPDAFVVERQEAIGQISKLFNLGVSAVQLGTSFIATGECDASNNFKQALIDAVQKKIRLIKSLAGMPARAIENDFLLAAESGERRPKGCKYHCIRSCDPKTTDYCIAEALLSAWYGKFDSGFPFTRATGYNIKSITTVKEVFEHLKNEFYNSLNLTVNYNAATKDISTNYASR